MWGTLGNTALFFHIGFYKFSCAMAFPGHTLLVLYDQWPSTNLYKKALNRWYSLQWSASSIFRGKMKLGKIGAACCHVTFSLCLLIFFAFTPGLIGELLRVSAFEHGTVLKAGTGFERGSRQLFLAPAVRRWNSSRLDKVINAALSPGVVPFWKAQNEPMGGRCVPAAHVYHPSPQALSTRGKR